MLYTHTHTHTPRYTDISAVGNKKAKMNTICESACVCVCVCVCVFVTETDRFVKEYFSVYCTVELTEVSV